MDVRIPRFGLGAYMGAFAHDPQTKNFCEQCFWAELISHAESEAVVSRGIRVKACVFPGADGAEVAAADALAMLNPARFDAAVIASQATRTTGYANAIYNNPLAGVENLSIEGDLFALKPSKERVVDLFVSCVHLLNCTYETHDGRASWRSVEPTKKTPRHTKRRN